MICFFCLEPRSASLEHVFPKAIGGTLTTERVCKPCNDQLGSKVDALVTDHIFIQFRRSDLGLEGQSGKIPNAVKALLGRGVMTTDPEQRVKVVVNPMTGKLEPRILPKKTIRVLDDGTHEEGIFVDVTTPPDEIRRIVLRIHKRKNLIPLTDEELEIIVAQCRSSVVTVVQPEVKTSIQVDLTNCRRGLVKIAYELACMWLGDNYLNDPLATVCRDFVLGRASNEESRLRGMFDIIRPDVLRFWPADNETHIAYAMVVNGSVSIVLKVFETFFMVLQMTEHAELYDVRDSGASALRFIEVDVCVGTHRESLFSEEIMRLGSAYA